MIEELLPDAVACAEAFDDPADAVLFAEEEALIAKAVDKRRREFTTARHCARQAMAKLGLPPAAVLPGERGAPQWPAGVVGTMTHCAGYRAAALALDTEVASVGIDAEPHDVLPDGVLKAIAVPAELAWLPSVSAAHPDVCWDRLLFSAKESVYKTWFPLTRKWLGFEDASVTVDPVGGTFQARLLVPGPFVAGAELTGFTGRWMVRDGLILTAISV
ncbi:4'-phosphopantetheinyl transferase superfamily protein [Solihabitans fulvus]|uniref:4'-phosphopantetheinyl transferase superfamily protein n=1 Tax=Solihabitans fulvus TaxID=1892852 RepID=A0A5B2XTL1_9PSEU|nr:4'-phosphopantetheinyl transferase superfamily protein [Solihabitans fulvus]KAA2267017.1 4'-phosphopantetheinyl transferase superfamily protein [Solihabitans fulvus]